MGLLHVGLFTECYRPIQNGIVASVDALAGALRARGHAVVCVAPRMPGYTELRDDLIRVPSLPLPTRTAYRLTLPLLDERRARALSELSIVHTHSPFVTGWMGVRCARRLRVPLVFTYHTQLEEYAHYVPFDLRATRNAAGRLTRAYANACDAVIVPTAAMELRLRELGVRARIEVVPSGIDVAQFASGRRREDLRARLGVGPHDKMLLSVGRLGREKNLELALEAFARLGDPATRLVVVGDGVHREALEREAARLGVARRITFAREFPREALPDAYASADAFIFTSRSETQGLVLVEALAGGLGVVAVDTPQTRDVLGGAGRVVPADPLALAAALRAVLDGDERGGRARGAQVALRYDGARLAERVLALYAALRSEGNVVAASA
ncbi:MAG: glycosyltransferase [Vulcanimicrobiaceae bacterium]